MKATERVLIATASVLAAAAMALATTAPATAAPQDARPPSLLVKVGPHVDAQALAERRGMVVRRELREIGWVELGLPPAASGARAAAAAVPQLRADRAVRKVSYVRPSDDFGFHFVPRDPIFDATLNDGTPDGLPAAWHLIQTNFPVAWDITTGSPNVRVAVIDSEFDTSNPDLINKLVVRYNAASGTAEYHTVDVKAKPGNQAHGSHTSGLVGAQTDNGIGVAGACFDCGVIAIKIGGEAAGQFVGASFLGDVAEGLIYAADNGAQVVNMSLGGPRAYAPLQDAVNYALARNVVVVASAGNAQQTRPGPNYPAAYPGVLAVGATDSQGQIASFSSQGDFVGVSAPGVDVVSTTDGNGGDPEAQAPFGDGVAIDIKSGTSMSAPIVAGLAGLMRTVRPDLSHGEVVALIKGSARDVGIAGPDPVYGAGIIDAPSALRAAQSYVRPAPPPPPAPPAPPAAPAPPGPTCATVKIGRAKALKPAKRKRGRVKSVGTSLRLSSKGQLRIVKATLKFKKGRRTVSRGLATGSRRAGKRAKLSFRLRHGTRGLRPRKRVVLVMKVRARPRQKGCGYGKPRTLRVKTRVGWAGKRGAI